MTPAGDQLLAHHVALLAIPAIVPAVVVVGVVLYIARKDRLDERAERELIERAFDTDPDETDRPDRTDRPDHTDRPDLKGNE